MSEANRQMEPLRLRYEGTCCYCGTRLEPGSTAWYDRAERTVHCQACPDATASGRLGGTPTPGAETDAIGLAQVAGPLLRVLRDCPVPKATVNIESIVVCPGGVYVIASQRYQDKPIRRRLAGGLRRPRTEELLVDRVERTSLLDTVHAQSVIVRQALAASDTEPVPVQAAMCFLDARWPRRGGEFAIHDAWVMSPERLRARLTQPGELDEAAITEVQRRLRRAFPRRVRALKGSATTRHAGPGGQLAHQPGRRWQPSAGPAE